MVKFLFKKLFLILKISEFLILESWNEEIDSFLNAIKSEKQEDQEHVVVIYGKMMEDPFQTYNILFKICLESQDSPIINLAILHLGIIIRAKSEEFNPEQKAAIRETIFQHVIKTT